MTHARLETATLGDVDDSYYYGAECQKCRHRSRLNLLSLRAHLGADYPLRNIRPRLSCEQCGARGPIVSFLTPAHRGSNVVLFREHPR